MNIFGCFLYDVRVFKKVFLELDVCNGMFGKKFIFKEN